MIECFYVYKRILAHKKAAWHRVIYAKGFLFFNAPTERGLWDLTSSTSRSSPATYWDTNSPAVCGNQACKTHTHTYYQTVNMKPTLLHASKVPYEQQSSWGTVNAKYVMRFNNEQIIMKKVLAEPLKNDLFNSQWPEICEVWRINGTENTAILTKSWQILWLQLFQRQLAADIYWQKDWTRKLLFFTLQRGVMTKENIPSPLG